MKQVSWTLKNLPALSREPQVSVIGGDLPLLTATTEEKPLSFLASQWQLEGDAGIRALAGKLTAGAKDDKEKVIAIRDYVIDNLYYSSLPLAESGYRIRPAAEVIRSAYGTEAEKANLMAALLKAAGLKRDRGGLRSVREYGITGSRQHPRTVCVDRRRRQPTGSVTERQNSLSRFLAERLCLCSFIDAAV